MASYRNSEVQDLPNLLQGWMQEAAAGSPVRGLPRNKARVEEERRLEQEEVALRLAQEGRQELPPGGFRGGRPPDSLPGSGLAALLDSNPLLCTTLSRAVGSRLERRPPGETPRRLAPTPAARSLRFTQSATATGELAATALKMKVTELEKNLTSLHSTMIDEICRPPQDPSQLQHIRALVSQSKEFTSTLLGEAAGLAALSHHSPSLRDLDSKLRTAKGTVTSLEMLLERQKVSVGSHLDALPQAPTTSTTYQDPPSLLNTSSQHRQGQAYLPRAALPSFGGEVQDYWEFREVFRSLMDGVYLEPSVYIMQLKNQLTAKEAKNMLRGVRSIPKAWSILDSHYGDRLAAIATIT